MHSFAFGKRKLRLKKSENFETNEYKHQAYGAGSPFLGLDLGQTALQEEYNNLLDKRMMFWGKYQGKRI